MLIRAKNNQLYITIIAVSMFTVVGLLYKDIVVVPFFLGISLFFGITIYTDNNRIFHVFSFAFFYPWLVFNEIIIIYDRQFSIMAFTLLSVIMAVNTYVYGEDKGQAFEYSSIVYDIIIAASFFGLPIIRFIEQSKILGFTLVVLSVYWAEFFSKTILNLFSIIQSKQKWTYKTTKDTDKKYIVFILISMLLLGLLFSVIYYPGIITRDCASIYRAAQHINDSLYRTDIHSFGWTIMVAIIDRLFHNYYAITLTLVVSFVLAWTYNMLLLNESGLSNKIIIIITLLWFCIPINWYYICCSWKDMPFTVCIMIVTSFICSILFGKGIKRKPLRFIALILSSFGMSIFRSNGQIILMVLLIVSVIEVLRKKTVFRELALCFGIATVLLLGFKGPFFRILGVASTPEGLYALPYIDGVWENVYKDVDISKDTVYFIETEIMPVEDFKMAYESGYTNRYAFPKGFENISLSKARKAYFDCLISHPFVTISARFKRTYNIWGIMLDSEYPMDRNFIAEIPRFDDFSSDYQWGFSEKYEDIRQGIGKLASGSHVYGFFAIVFSRCGFCIVLWTLLIRFCKSFKEELLYVFIPSIVNVIVLLIGSCYADYRYSYPMFIMTLFYIGIAFLSQRNLQLQS